MSYNATGYWVTCDEALCSDCFNDPDYEWPGFESWQKPLTITSEQESDTPTHCSECKELIGHDLTTDGYTYVESAIEGCIMHGHGDAEIVKLWLEEYRDGLEFEDIITNCLEARI